MMMQNVLKTGLAALALGFVAPAQAASNLDCMMKVIDTQVAANVFTAFKEGRNIGDQLFSDRGKEIIACRETNKWTDEVTEAAARVVFGDILSEGVAKEMKDSGFAVDKFRPVVDRYLANSTETAQVDMAEGRLDEKMVNDLLDHLTKEAGIKVEEKDEKTGGQIGAYLSARANAVYFRMAFARL